MESDDCMTVSNTKHKMGKGRKIILIVLLAVAFIIAGTILFRVIYREALRSKHAIKTPNGIDLMETVRIGDIQQALYFRGQNTDNPVILYLHGWPAATEMQFLHGFQYEWEHDFTVVHWDQRQAGKTFLANNPDEVGAVTFERLLEDAWEVTQYIQNKLGKEKIILLGHSGGTILGTALVQSHPQAFSAYIGVGQVTNYMENDRIGYNLVLEKAREAGHTKDIAELESLGSYLTDPYDASVFTRMGQVRRYQDKYGVGTGVDMNVMLLALSSPYYSFRETLVLFGNVWEYQIELFRYAYTEYDAESLGTEYAMPVFYVQGENDFLTTQGISFIDKIEAPDKRLFYIPEAGHMTMMNHPKEFARVLLEEIAPLIP